MKTNIPDAFKKTMPVIREKTDSVSHLEMVRPCKVYKMGKIHIVHAPPHEGLPEMLSIMGKDKYPTWDEMVWVRYQLCPHVEDMALILPPLEDYINYTGGRGKYTFTMEAIERFREGS